MIVLLKNTISSFEKYRDASCCYCMVCGRQQRKLLQGTIKFVQGQRRSKLVRDAGLAEKPSTVGSPCFSGARHSEKTRLTDVQLRFSIGWWPAWCTNDVLLSSGLWVVRELCKESENLKIRPSTVPVYISSNQTLYWCEKWRAFIYFH